MRLCWHDRIVGRRPVPESQERTKIGMGRKKLRSPVDARAVRIFEAAAQMEKDLTEDLRAEGYTVAGGT